MRQIYPVRDGADAGGDQAPVDVAVAYAHPPADQPPRARPAAPMPAHEGTVLRGGPVLRAGPEPRAWVRANMVASADGAAALDGRSGGLSSAADRHLFMTLRALADVILVGGQTVRTERYGPARPRDDWPRLRAGRPPSPPIAVVTGKLDLDLSSPLFTEAPPHARTIVLTTSAAPPSRCALAARHAEVVIAGQDRVDLAAAVGALAGRGLVRVLTEGGPRLLGQLVTAGVLDELCLTVAPVLAGGSAGRILAAAAHAPWPLVLAQVLEEDGSLFCRYLVGAAGGRAADTGSAGGTDNTGTADGARAAGTEASEGSIT